MVFKVQDGIEFATRAEWRKYMMDTYYSCKNKHGEQEDAAGQQQLTFTKGPGSIAGQMFNISDCSNCKIVIMDHCEQVQIDNVQNCQIFIGASASTIFVRNCDKCTIYCCSRQLRLRECFDCAFYVFSPSEVHIEMSKHVVFAPFMGGYAEHKDHLAAAKLNTEQNLWHQVYDHNDPDKTNANWSLLPVKDRNSPWFPDGSSALTFPSALSDEGALGVTTALGQVGESYGIDRMIKDQKAAASAPAPAAAEPAAKAARAPSTTSAAAVASPEKSKIDEKIQIDFTSLPLRSQGASVKQLGIEVALLIAAATVKGINHTMWLQDDPAVSAVPAVEFNTKLTSLGLAVGIQESWDAKRELDLATSKASLKNIFSLCGFFSNDGTPMIDVNMFLRLASERVQEHLKHIQVGSSPVAPAKTEANQVAPVEPVQEFQTSAPPAASKLSPKPASPKPASPKVTSPASKAPSPVPVPSIPPIPKEVEVPAVRKARTPERRVVDKPKTAPTQSRFSFSEMSFGDSRPRAHSTERARRSTVRESTSSTLRRTRSKSRDGSVRLQETKTSWTEDFESTIKRTVQQADLYHLIQVHLGYIKPYTMIPARGEIIKSSPRQWLTAREIQTAFFAARLRLSDFEVKALINLVGQFAQSAKTITLSNTIQDGAEGGVTAASGSISIVPSEDAEPVMNAGRLSSKWLGLYMVHLRLQRPSKPWLEWLGTKLKLDESTAEDKPKEFKRVLAGKPHKLSKAEIESFLSEFELLPEQFLREEIDRRVEAYDLDMQGRMDIHHDLQLKVQHWERANPGPHKAAEVAKATVDLKEELLRKHRFDLGKSEEDSGAITKDLFWKFDAACRKNNYTGTSNFGKWLEDYGTKQRHLIEVLKANSSLRQTSSFTKSSRKHSYAAINEMEDLIRSMYEQLPANLQALQLQFRKALVLMRRETEAARLASSRVVTKETFDRHFGDLLLSPHITASSGKIIWSLALEARRSHNWRWTLDSDEATAQQGPAAAEDVFANEIAVAVKRSKDFEQKHRSSVTSGITEWKTKKIQQIKEEKAKKAQEDEAKLAAEAKARKAAAASYKKWLKLRRKNMYLSKAETRVSGSGSTAGPRVVPAVTPAQHPRAWSKEVDLSRLRPELNDFDA